MKEPVDCDFSVNNLLRYADYRKRKFEAETYLFGILHFASCEKREVIIGLARRFMPDFDFDFLIESLKNEGIIKQTHSILLMNKKHPSAQELCAQAFDMHLETFCKEFLDSKSLKLKKEKTKRRKLKKEAGCGH